MNTFFFSPKCKYCIHCLKIITPYKDQFNFLEYINIHTVGKDNLPKQIQKVPSIVLLHNDNMLLLEGKEAFQWIYDTISHIESSKKNLNTSSPTSMFQNQLQQRPEMSTQPFQQSVGINQVQNQNQMIQNQVQNQNQMIQNQNRNQDQFLPSATSHTMTSFSNNGFSSDNHSSNFSDISSIQKNLSDNINFSNIQQIEPQQQKIAITPDMLSSQREQEIKNLNVT